MKRQVYLQTVGAAALLAMTTPVYAQSGGWPSGSGSTAQQFGGDIQPFSGDIDPFAGDIDPFAGDINPFRGDVDPFYGDINPFWGDISPFWGDISPFAGDVTAFSGNVDPFWGDAATAGTPVAGIGEFWSQAGPQWGQINQNWSALGSYSSATQGAYDAVLNDFTSLIDTSRTTWGSAVQAATGQTFDQAFADPILAKYGIDLNDASSFENIDGATRSQFFLEFYDGLMAYSGRDQIDHWMPLVNWRPSITQDQGNGHDAVVGLLDVAISMTDDNVEYLQNVGGYTVSPNEHGAAVASLIAGRHDGQGVLGIAPRATVKSYSPFDATGSANFADVENGVNVLTNAGANVINMSLGVPGWTFHQDIADIFRTPMLQSAAGDTVFVIASGNNGVTQTQNINKGSTNDFSNLLLVGSVDPNKNISSFSNRPGEACFTNSGVCTEENKLKNHFLVAPGELILVSDNNGGTTRLSGTSFAAPIVTGAISLIHDRWPWLQNFAQETVDIVLQTAEDLGAPGVDSVYGHGLLDVEAAVSPLNFDNLTFYSPSGSGFTTQTASQFRNTLVVPGQLNLWEVAGESVFAIENIGDTYRDFSIPLSTVLHGQSGTFNGGTEQYQRHIYNRLVDWAGGTNTLVAKPHEAQVAKVGEWGLTMRAAPVSQFAPSQTQDRPFNTSFLIQSQNRKVTFQIGEGAGSVALTHTEGFDHYTDYDPAQGGVNPFLGLASGGMFANIVSEIKPGLKLAFGFSEVRDDHTYADETTGERLRDFDTLSDYQASAIMLDVSYAVAKNVRLNASFTRLDEETGVLGAQGEGAFSLDQGAVTNALTVGASYDISPRFSLSASASAGRTLSNGFGGGVLGVSEEGLTSTAFEFAATAKSLLKDNDRLRLTFAQPLNIEAGALEYQSVQVVNRATGELGVVNEFWNLGSGNRHYVTEAQYAFPLMEGAAEVSVFGRMDIGAVDIDGEYNSFAAGSRFTLSF